MTSTFVLHRLPDIPGGKFAVTRNRRILLIWSECMKRVIANLIPTIVFCVAIPASTLQQVNERIYDRVEV